MAAATLSRAAASPRRPSAPATSPAHTLQLTLIFHHKQSKANSYSPDYLSYITQPFQKIPKHAPVPVIHRTLCVKFKSTSFYLQTKLLHESR